MNLPTLASGPPPTKTQAQLSVSPLSKISIMLAAAVVAFVGTIAPTVLAATPVTVIIGATLNPKEITIRPGTLVIWSNEDSERHRARSTTGPVGFDSGNLDPGESFSFTFNAAGTFPYFYTLDPGMVGTVTIVEAATVEDLAVSDPTVQAGVPVPSTRQSPEAGALIGSLFVLAAGITGGLGLLVRRLLSSPSTSS